VTASFRFGYQSRALDAAEVRASAASAERAGFDVFSTFDHLGPHPTALLPLVIAAEATSTMRLCPLVVNNDFHHPVALAQEIATLDHLSGGRAELGIGAGHAFTEYATRGLEFDEPAVRKRRLAASVEIIRQLLDGGEVTWRDEHYEVAGARSLPALQSHLPILVGVNGREALTHAARHADTIGLTMLGRTLDDGQRHEVRWEQDRLDATIAHIRSEAAACGRTVELNALVQRIVVTDDRRAAAREICDTIDGLAVDDALTTPFLAIGSADEMAGHLTSCRDRWGISYFTVRDVEAFAPVIDLLRA
jgi:probable F420-dependent oxidoreductase